MKYTRWVFIFLFVLMGLLLTPWLGHGLFAADEVVYEAGMSHADSVQAWKKGTHKDTGFDIASDVAAETVFFPLHLVFIGAREGVRLLTEPTETTWLMELLFSADGRRRIVPISSPTNGTGLKLKYKPDPEQKANLAASAAWWLYGRQTYRLMIDRWPLATRLTGTVAAEYHIDPNEQFFGIGMATRERDETHYKHETRFVESRLHYHLMSHLAVNGYGSFAANNFHEAAVGPAISFSDPGSGLFYFDPSYRNHIDMVHAGLGIELNTAVNPSRPRNGWIAELSGGYHAQTNGEDFGYWDNQVLVGKHFPLLYDRVLYIDAGGQFTEPLAHRQIPFFELPELGGRETLRGFERGRYSGEHVVHGTVEYRFPIRDVWDESGLDFSFFADWGKVVQEDTSDWDTDSMQIGYGFSLQTWTSEGWGARLDVGFSREGAKLYLVMGI